METSEEILLGPPMQLDSSPVSPPSPDPASPASPHWSCWMNDPEYPPSWWVHEPSRIERLRCWKANCVQAMNQNTEAAKTGTYPRPAAWRLKTHRTIATKNGESDPCQCGVELLYMCINSEREARIWHALNGWGGCTLCRHGGPGAAERASVVCADCHSRICQRCQSSTTTGEVRCCHCEAAAWRSPLKRPSEPTELEMESKCQRPACLSGDHAEQ